METKTDFACWLSKKLYLQTLGLYANVFLTVGLLFGFTKIFALSLEPSWHMLVFGGVVGIINVFLSMKYEKMVIFEKKWSDSFSRYRKWHDKPDDPFVRLNAKLKKNTHFLWFFYSNLAFFTYIFYGWLHYNFYPVFMIGFFLSMVTEEGFTLEKTYEMQLTGRSSAAVLLWSALCAFASTAIIWSLVNYFNFSLLVAVITGVILIKLIQPLGSRKFVLGL